MDPIQLHSDTGTSLETLDRRREPREPAEGMVLLQDLDGTREPVEARLVDVSESGFRAAHRSRALCTGDLFLFRHASGRGLARAVWTLIRGENVQTGFTLVA